MKKEQILALDGDLQLLLWEGANSRYCELIGETMGMEKSARSGELRGILKSPGACKSLVEKFGGEAKAMMPDDSNEATSIYVDKLIAEKDAKDFLEALEDMLMKESSYPHVRDTIAQDRQKSAESIKSFETSITSRESVTVLRLDPHKP